MAGQDWNNLGKDLNRIIDDAVHMGNYGRLNESINSVLRKAFGGMDTTGSSSGWDFNLSGDDAGNKDKNKTPDYDYHYGNTQTGQYKYANDEGGGYTYNNGSRAATYSSAGNPYFAGSAKRKGGSIGLLIGGIVLTAVSGVSFIIFLLGTLILMESFGIGVLTVSAVAVIAGIFLIVKGNRGLKLSKQFDRYVSLLKGRTYGDIKMLAAYTHKAEAEVVKNLKKMMHKGWFLQGHLDQNETCLMTSHETYEQYMSTVKNAKLQQEEERRHKMEEAKKAGLTPEAKAVIDEGHTYIDKIKKSNDAIPGEEISNKIFKMELLVRRIFEQAEAHPENISDLRKLMEYYLPMTVKLLEAYEELDKQPIQGDNITGSKKEIEDTLDTLNIAFEKLLDSLFQDRAWDVSSDISVLQTMLAQEGLTKDDFAK